VSVFQQMRGIWGSWGFLQAIDTNMSRGTCGRTVKLRLFWKRIYLTNKLHNPTSAAFLQLLKTTPFHTWQFHNLLLDVFFCNTFLF